MLKERFDFIALIFSLVILSAFMIVRIPGGTIQGTVVSGDGNLNVCAIKFKDTVKANIVGGRFVIAKLKPGRYDLLIEGKKLTEIFVNDGRISDVGLIRLNK
ncbi:MAG TPA: hypothetical protein VK173_12090 [Lacibacter sp.]|nr:hypothetical protein [Lacibacter sp.]